MKFMKRPWLISSLFTVVILVVCGFYIGSLLTKENPLSEIEIKEQLESKYGGTVEEIAQEGDIYKTEMLRNGAVYSAEINAETGQVLSLIQLSEPKEKSPQLIEEEEARNIIAGKYTGEIERISLNKGGDVPIYEVEVAKNQALVTVIVDALAGEITSEIVKEELVENVLITKEEAVEIALGQLRGEVEYVTFEQTADGGFYLIEIEQDNDDDDGDDLEAVFQIHAISGEIISVSWED